MASLISGCAAIFPNYCKEQVLFEFKKPVVIGLTQKEGIPFIQKKVSEYTQVYGYTGLLSDSVVFGSTNRRFSYCVFNTSNDSLQIHVEPNTSYVMDDSIKHGSLSYFPVYSFNPGPDLFTYARYNSELKYQIRTHLGWLNIENQIRNQDRCGNEGMMRLQLLPGEVIIQFFARRDGPDRVDSRICFGNTCSEEFKSNVDLAELLPIKPTN